MSLPIEACEIPGHPGYLACPDGSIWSVKGREPRQLRPFNRRRSGGMAVNLTQGGVFKMHYVHRLVAMTFLPPPMVGQTLIMHGDDDTSNNASYNLRWGSPAENSKDMTDKCRQAKGLRIYGAKLGEAGARALRQDRVNSGLSLKALARKYCITKSSARSVVVGLSYRAGD